MAFGLIGEPMPAVIMSGWPDSQQIQTRCGFYALSARVFASFGMSNTDNGLVSDEVPDEIMMTPAKARQPSGNLALQVGG